MNGKKAKMLRRAGKGLTKKDKKLYNSLTQNERETLGVLYKHLEEKAKNV